MTRPDGKIPPPKTPPAGTDVATRSTGLTARMAMKFGIEPTTFLTTLKQTAFRQRGKNGAPAVEVTNEQMAMLLHIAEKYDLDPFVKQLYAFPSDGGITPIVPVDGWIEMINRHPQFDYMEIETSPPGTEFDDAWVAVTIKRKDRAKPIRIEEWLKECFRETDPWKSHPRRMLRHKGIIQCGRVAFGFSGIFDPDEEERIFAAAIDVTPRDAGGKPIVQPPKKKTTSPPPPPVDSAGWISLDQGTVLAEKLKAEGVPMEALCAVFEIGTLEDLPREKYTDALEAIDKLSTEGAGK